ncbi:UDP-4-amino-4,6-dideoxy-N-acetyl-beta-L-altrosamine transaminase [Paenibacillus sp. Soil522]|uniref:UDP-4-amino-4, 6-dideoxy-N-acetyl-beta-L-altrosamine transaminase n=1 Tax=Paenibacillus sp. Soil522 TaxID=1736388 RepID=UPI0006FA8492|nr:UDP-4-amino-4,6-dideoxy-N-acetyl-beta-L-altrosamine transaminase [Paenibacillus sp. Soil522]KRE46316.1 UDP-4-amino-4,6-dideoxy-N-acetyl-beta-L-altrosamine transaminase [Paenibacillus sp. Soil522]
MDKENRWSQLAIHGGRPVRNDFLPYGRQWLEEDDIEAVVNVLKSDYLTTGPKISEFESKLAETVGAKFAVAFSNGTAALHAACFVAGIKIGDEVITTPMTFAASANCILYNGGIPVFADIDSKTYNIHPDAVRKAVNEKTKAIIPVHFTGQPVDLDPILKIAKERGVVVIEDAAHALGASYKKKKIGSISDMTMFSFHPVKHITTGEGGIITTNSEEYYDKLVQFRTHGIIREPYKLNENQGPWYYEMHNLGFNYRMTDIQAGLGLSQLTKIDRFLERRKRIVSIYNEAFKSMEPYIRLPYQMAHGVSSCHLYILHFDTKKLNVGRNEIYKALLSENIGVNVHYIPVHLHPYYQSLGFKRGLCPVAEKVYEEIITIPLFAKMTEEDAQDVITAIRKVLCYYSSKEF